MPSQPRSPSLRLNAGSTPDSQVSTWVVKVPAASSAARNSRTSARTSSAAADRGAGASVNELLPMQCSPRRCGRTAPVLQGAAVPGSRGAIRARMAPGWSGGQAREDGGVVEVRGPADPGPDGGLPSPGAGGPLGQLHRVRAEQEPQRLLLGAD